MVAWWSPRRRGPIGVDIGSRSVKLLQLDAARSRICDAVRWDLPADPSLDPRRQDELVAEAIRRARDEHDFRGRDAVFCLGAGSLFVQNMRVAPAVGEELTKIVHFEAAGRLPFGSEGAEIRYLEAGDVKQGEIIRREVILMVSYRPSLDRLLAVAEQAGLRITAIDAGPAAMLRCYGRQLRRESESQRRMMFIGVGAASTMVIVARGGDPMFIKYIDIGGRHFDEAVAGHLKLAPGDAAALRRHDADRPTPDRDPEIARGVDDALRPVWEKLSQQLALCLRYYSVTFRGQPLDEAVLGGGEATERLAEWLSTRLDLPCSVGSPLRPFRDGHPAGRATQWDVAAGLAMRETH